MVIVWNLAITWEEAHGCASASPLTPAEVRSLRGAGWPNVDQAGGIAWRCSGDAIEMRGTAEKRKGCALNGGRALYANGSDYPLSWDRQNSREARRFMTGKFSIPAPAAPGLIQIRTTHEGNYSRNVPSGVWAFEFTGCKG